MIKINVDRVHQQNQTRHLDNVIFTHTTYFVLSYSFSVSQVIENQMRTENHHSEMPKSRVLHRCKVNNNAQEAAVLGFAFKRLFSFFSHLCLISNLALSNWSHPWINIGIIVLGPQKIFSLFLKEMSWLQSHPNWSMYQTKSYQTQVLSIGFIWVLD